MGFVPDSAGGLAVRAPVSCQFAGIGPDVLRLVIVAEGGGVLDVCDVQRGDARHMADLFHVWFDLALRPPPVASITADWHDGPIRAPSVKGEFRAVAAGWLALGSGGGAG